MAVRTKNRKRIKFDEPRALEIFKILNNGWRDRTGIFKDVILPQDQYPSPDEWDSFFSDDRERANWLLCVALTQRGGILSEVPFKLFWWLRQRFPEMFEPEIVVKKWSPEKIEQKLYLGIKTIFNAAEDKNSHRENQSPEDVQKKFAWMPKPAAASRRKGRTAGARTIAKVKEDIIGYKIKEISRHWHHNFIALDEYWGGNLLNVFWGVTDFEESFRRIDWKKKGQVGFRGMRRKIFSLLVIWMQGKGLIPVFPTPIPFDIHAQRILWATEILAKVDRAKPLQITKRHPKQLAGKLAIKVDDAFVDPVAKWSQEFIAANGLSHLNVNPALWILGRRLCAEHFQNTSREKATAYVEPEELADNPHLWPKNYKDPCSYCPIEEYCRWSIPDAPHSRWGLLVRLGRRIPYPKVRLPWLDWEKKVPYLSRKNRHS